MSVRDLMVLRWQEPPGPSVTGTKLLVLGFLRDLEEHLIQIADKQAYSRHAVMLARALARRDEADPDKIVSCQSPASNGLRHLSHRSDFNLVRSPAPSLWDTAHGLGALCFTWEVYIREAADLIKLAKEALGHVDAE